MAMTKEKMQAYETVRKSGLTNMFHIPNVIYAADGVCGVLLTRDDCLYIMSNYGKLMEHYNIKRG